jgi:hypothetical protein
MPENFKKNTVKIRIPEWLNYFYQNYQDGCENRGRVEKNFKGRV